MHASRGWSRLFLAVIVTIVFAAWGFVTRGEISSAATARGVDMPTSKPTSAAADFYMYQLEVFCERQVASKIFNARGGGSMGTKTICVGNCVDGTITLEKALSGVPDPVAASFVRQIEEHERKAASGEGRSIRECLGTTPKAEEDPKGATGSAATSDDLVDLTVRCPFTATVRYRINWEDDIQGSYTDSAGGSGGINFEVDGFQGSDTHETKGTLESGYPKREGQKIYCRYETPQHGSLNVSRSYVYRVNREIVSCFPGPGASITCKVRR